MKKQLFFTLFIIFSSQHMAAMHVLSRLGLAKAAHVCFSPRFLACRTLMLMRCMVTQSDKELLEYTVPSAYSMAL